MFDKSEMYLEILVFVMFVYGFVKGVNEGWFSFIYGLVVIIGWNGVVMCVFFDGCVEGICEGMIYVNDNLYYYFCGVSVNMMFFGFVFYVGLEMMKFVKNFVI